MFFCYEYDTLTFDFIQSIVKISDSWGEAVSDGQTLRIRGGYLMEKAKKLLGDSCFDRYFFWLLIAVELLMSFTFLGYIHIPPISVTTAYIPILAAGCLFSPVQSVIIGIVFGITSMYKASASFVFNIFFNLFHFFRYFM